MSKYLVTVSGWVEAIDSDTALNLVEDALASKVPTWELEQSETPELVDSTDEE